MDLFISGFEISSIDKSTVVFVLVFQLIAVVAIFLLYRLYKLFFSAGVSVKPDNKNSEVSKKSVSGNHSPMEGKEKAAIAMAIYLHMNEMHDTESNIITIQRVSKAYSPWSSKIYNMRNLKR